MHEHIKYCQSYDQVERGGGGRGGPLSQEELQSITFSVDKLRRLGPFDGWSDEKIAALATFLADYSVLVYKTMLYESERQ